jgi:hypothetical protein
MMSKKETIERFGGIKQRNQLILDYCQQERSTIQIQAYFNMENNYVNGAVKFMVKHNYLQRVDRIVIGKDKKPRNVGHYTSLKKVYDFDYKRNKPANTSPFETVNGCAIQDFLNDKYLSGLVSKFEGSKKSSLVINGWR